MLSALGEELSFATASIYDYVILLVGLFAGEKSQIFFHKPLKPPSTKPHVKSQPSKPLPTPTGPSLHVKVGLDKSLFSLINITAETITILHNNPIPHTLVQHSRSTLQHVGMALHVFQNHLAVAV